ncbi:MAG: GspE/PulE family protein [Patescibacteria group bacterium]|nr:GspE/PulE family protein [Patescibacteria group bacterium]
MANQGPQSIEDLIPSRQKKGATSATGEKLKEKMGEVREAELERLAESKAQSLGVPYINLKGFAISPEALALIPREQAEKLKILCFLYTGPELRLAALEPADEKIKEVLFQLEERLHTDGKIYLVTEQSLNRSMKLYDVLPEPRKIIKGVEISADDLLKFQETVADFKSLQAQINKVSTTEILALAIAAALRLGASDIHVEAEEHAIKLRLRIDGVLQDAADIDQKKWKQIISRIKLVAGLKINVTDKPQDGRFTIFMKDEEVDVRVSAIPTNYGESVVMRILSKKAIALEFDALGIRGRALEILSAQITRPNGMILTTGPTGSGKTTTLYAILKKIKNPELKIITLEDPIEYRLEGISQSQIDPSHDYTFAKGLRSILRQDPDIIMVGEIRDLETADIAINAALTGHLVISTIHTNNAAGAIPRFLAMGAKGFLLAPALNAVIGQRLCRKICSKCKAEIKLDAATQTRILEVISKIPEKSGVKVDMKNLKFWKGAGCDACNGLGYKGRVGIYEIFTMNKDIEKAILAEEVAEYKMEELAAAQGMITMVQDGVLKALDGMTSVDEVFRVTE